MIRNISKQFVGEGIASLLSEPRRRAFLANFAQMRANYGDTVDAALLEEQILLCKDTYEALYSTSPTAPVYVKGSRPELEAIASEVTVGAKSDSERVISLSRFCSELWRRHNGRILFYGGREEELIRKGEQLCECLARLLSTFCTVLGLPSRIVTHTVSGHLTCEVYADGAWGYIDPRKNLYFLDERGRLASAWRLWRDQSLFKDQPEGVKADFSPRFSYGETVLRCPVMYFHPDEVITFKYYDPSDSRYSYGWRTNDDLAAAGINGTSREYAIARSEVFGIPVPQSGAEFEWSIQRGQLISEPIPVSVRVKGLTVPPCRASFAIDGKTVWKTDGTVAPAYIHKAAYGVWFLYGDGGLLDPREYGSGEHIISFRAEVEPGEWVEYARTFKVPEKF